MKFSATTVVAALAISGAAAFVPFSAVRQPFRSEFHQDCSYRRRLAQTAVRLLPQLDRLRLHLWVPPGLEYHHQVRLLEVEALAASLEAHQDHLSRVHKCISECANVCANVREREAYTILHHL